MLASWVKSLRNKRIRHLLLAFSRRRGLKSGESCSMAVLGVTTARLEIAGRSALTSNGASSCILDVSNVEVLLAFRQASHMLSSRAQALFPKVCLRLMCFNVRTDVKIRHSLTQSLIPRRRKRPNFVGLESASNLESTLGGFKRQTYFVRVAIRPRRVPDSTSSEAFLSG